jgi:hypothetical protein
VMEIIHKVGVLFIQNGRAIDFTTFDTIWGTPLYMVGLLEHLIGA